MSEKTRNQTVVTTPSDLEIQIDREFDAPRELVWECFEDPELLVEWLGPRRLKMRIEKYDFRVGGEWRYIHSDEGGNDFVFFGEFREITKPELMEQTFTFVMEPPVPPQIDRCEFIELDGGKRTLLRTVSTFEVKEARDGMLQSGMESGVSEGNERLDELLARRLASGE
ncbi:MAG: SRPBCC family protein [Solirubrobacterales bacterium]|nr:SRPBCC family protein [Solirubrobacterales bacterium]